MNKKLFSWKALAGLALLVAMGLTSCQQGSQVDPSDPTGANTPTKPSISTKGTADVTITITAAGELASQWKKLDSKTVEALREKTTLNIAVNNAGYELDGETIYLPNFFTGAENGTTGKIVNITFTNGFENAGSGWTKAEYADANVNKKLKKKMLSIDTENLAGNQVNFYFAAGEFDMNLKTTKVQASLNSAANAKIGILYAQTGEKKSALKINSGVTVDAISLSTGDVVLNGGALNAKLIDATATEDYIAVNGWNWGAGGFKVGSADVVYVKSLVVGDGVNNVTVTTAGLADFQGSANVIKIKKYGKIDLTDIKPHVTSIIGEHANAQVNILGSLDNGLIQDVSTIGALEKVRLSDTNGNWLNISDDSKYKDVVFVTNVLLTTNTVSDVTFNKVSIPVSADNVTFKFTKVGFNKSSVLNADGTTTVYPNLYADYETQTSTKTLTWQWIVNGTSGYWQQVTSNKPLTAINAGVEAQEFHSSAVNPTEGSATLGGWNAGAVTSTVLKITYTTEDYIWPEGTVVSLDNCKEGSDKIQVANANNLFGNVSEKTAWYDVELDGVTLKWRLNSSDQWVLVNK